MLALIDPLLIPIISITFAVGVPAVALATHFVLRPMVRDITEAIRAGRPDTPGDVSERLTRLEEAYYQLDQSVTRLLEAEEFRRQLEK